MKKHIAAQWLIVISAIALTVVPALDEGAAAPLPQPGRPPFAETAANSANLSDLPLAAQGQISAALGRDQSSYHAAPRAQGFRMKNPRHGLTADFTSADVQVRMGAARWKLAFRGYGYGDKLRATAVAKPHATLNHVEYRHGDLTEWYVNGPLGVEQGFTLARPPGKSTDEPLTLAFKLSGNLHASADASGRDLILSRADGTAALRYRGLTAYDATGRELRAWLEVKGEQLCLRVDDAGAQYPVVVDPFIQKAKLTAFDSAPNDQFGQWVAVSDDTIVIGAPLDDVGANADQGSAYVFSKPAGGWNTPIAQPAKLLSSDGMAGDQFGFSVAVDGDTIVVGAPEDDEVGPFIGNGQGSAYVFVKPESGWSGTLNERAKLMADVGPLSIFGRPVAISGDTIVVGTRRGSCAHDGSAGLFQQGEAWVFEKPPAGWGGDHFGNAQLCASDGGVSDTFGVVAISGDTIVAGAPLDDILVGTTNQADRGSAYVFMRPNSGWSGHRTQNAKLTAGDGVAGDQFGFSVDVDGDTVVIGAALDDVPAGCLFCDALVNKGAAYVFVKPAAGWINRTQNAKLSSSDVFDKEFGRSVAVSGDTIVVGSNLSPTSLFSGAAWLFAKPAAGWINATQNARLNPSGQGVTGSLGNSVAVDGGTIVIGAFLEGADNRGAAYVFAENDPPSLSLPANITIEATSAAGAVVNFSATADDAVDGPVPAECAPPSGSTFPLGTTTVNCSASDAVGNTASASFDVTVVDTTPPALSLPGGELTQEATSAAGAVVNYQGTAHDLVDGDLTAVCTPASGTQFPLGTTSVNCTIADAAGNTVSGSFNVTVVDTTAPELTLPPNITLEATSAAGAVVTYANATANDLVDGTIAVVCSPASGAQFSLGVTTVNCTVTDTHSNSSSGTFTVAVLDTTPPVLTLPANITTNATSSAGAVVGYTATATDLVDGPVPPVCTPASGSTFAVGTTNVNCTAADNAGNSVAGSFTVTVDPGTIAFASFNALAQIDLRPGANDDLFAIEALFVLGAGSNGIDPLNEPVTVTLQSATWTILPGSFQRGRFGGFVFNGVLGTTRLAVAIQPLQGGKFAFLAIGSGAELSGIANPVAAGLIIGNDGGGANVTAKIK